MDDLIAGPSRRRGTIALALSSYALIGLSIIRGLVLVPLYLKCVGGPLYGAWLATGNVIVYLGLFDFGLNSVLTQRVAEAYGAKNWIALGRLIGTGLVAGLSLSSLPLLVAVAVSGMLPRFIPVHPEDVEVLKVAFMIGAVSASFMLAGYALGGVLIGLQRQALHGGILISSSMIGVVVTVVLLWSGWGLMSIPVGHAVQSILIFSGEAVGVWYLGSRLLPAGEIRPEWRTLKKLIGPTAWVFFARGGSTLSKESDSLIIGMMMGSQAVVVFGLTKRALDILLMVVGHSVGAFGPALAHLFGEKKGETGVTKGLTEELIRVTLVFAIVLIGGYVLLDKWFVGLWVGSPFYGGDRIALLLGIAGALSVLSVALNNIMFSRGRIATTTIASLAEAGLRIALMIALGKWMGLTGVALAAIGGFAASGLGILWVSYHREHRIPVVEGIRKTVSAGVAGLGVVGVGVLVRQLDEPRAWYSFAVASLLYILGACVWVLLVDRRTRDLMTSVIRGREIALGASGRPGEE